MIHETVRPCACCVCFCMCFWILLLACKIYDVFVCVFVCVYAGVLMRLCILSLAGRMHETVAALCACVCMCMCVSGCVGVTVDFVFGGKDG